MEGGVGDVESDGEGEDDDGEDGDEKPEEEGLTRLQCAHEGRVSGGGGGGGGAEVVVLVTDLQTTRAQHLLLVAHGDSGCTNGQRVTRESQAETVSTSEDDVRAACDDVMKGRSQAQDGGQHKGGVCRRP